jgi:hypothetical protein
MGQFLTRSARVLAGFKIAINSLPSGSDVDPAHDVLKMSHSVRLKLTPIVANLHVDRFMDRLRLFF